MHIQFVDNIHGYRKAVKCIIFYLMQLLYVHFKLCCIYLNEIINFSNNIITIYTIIYNVYFTYYPMHRGKHIFGIPLHFAMKKTDKRFFHENNNKKQLILKYKFLEFLNLALSKMGQKLDFYIASHFKEKLSIHKVFALK